MPVCNLEPVEKAHAVVNLALSDCLSPSEVCAFRLTKVSVVMGKMCPNLRFECTSTTVLLRNL